MEFPWGSPIPRGEDYGIIAEPYFDVDFGEMLYLTDTGRRWDGDEVSVRDKVRGQMTEGRNLRFQRTWDLIEAAERGLLPDKVMLNTHPQRWDDRLGPWVKELVGQNVKNVIKRYFFVRR